MDIFSNKIGRPQKYNSDIERKEAILKSEKKWADKTKDKKKL